MVNQVGMGKKKNKMTQPRIQITEVKPVLCTNCGSGNVIKYGSYNGEPRYLCHDCNRKFKGDEAAFHSRVPAEYISSALCSYYEGMSINDIRNHLRQQYSYYPSKGRVFEWIEKFTEQAVKQFRQYQPKVGNRWIADETVLTLDNGHNVWFWDLIDSKTRFLLASRVSFTRTTEHAKRLFEEARKRAGRYPKYMVTDKLNTYFDGVAGAYGAKSEHIMTSPFGEGKDSTSKIERWHGTLKDRTKVMKSFKNMDTLLSFTDGYLVYYNFLKPHEALKGKTPAEAAKIDYPHKNWADIVRQPVPLAVEVSRHKDLHLKAPRIKGTMPRSTRPRTRKPREMPRGDMLIMKDRSGGTIISRRKQKGARVVRRVRRLL